MKRQALLLLALLLAALALAPRPARAAQSYGSCTGFIASLPAVIATAGTWCFNQDLNTAITSGIAVTINADDVVLDCNDFKLDGIAGGAPTLAYGVFDNGKSNVTVRNCNIRGFYYGVALSAGSGHLVEDNRLDNNTYIGVRIDGQRSIARHNRIADTGGSSSANPAYGIFANGSVDVLDNSVGGVLARTGGGGNAYGIYTTGNLAGSINGNRVRTVIGDGAGRAFGIYNNASDRVVMRDNDLLGNGAAMSVGLRCATANGSTRDNLILGYAAGISLCSNDGGNVNAP